MQNILRDCRIFEAWSDEAWTVDGAAVRVSIICFAHAPSDLLRRLDGQSVSVINADLSSNSFDLTRALQLRENRDIRLCTR